MKTKLFRGCALLALALSLSLFASSNPKDEFTAHEWGTFTSVQGADGIQLEWNPFLRTDLPEFVYNRAVRQGGFPASYRLLNTEGKGGPGTMPTYTRLETPVIYFYSDKERTADVLVNFPAGRITEWYPQATRVGPYVTSNKTEMAQAGRSFIEWKGVKILPRDTKEVAAEQLIRDPNAKNDRGESHYYAARETDANFLRASSPYARSGAEFERDLFYRGVGMFQGPLTLRLDGDENYLHLSTAYAEPLTDLFVLTIRHGQARYQTVDRVGKDHERAVKLESQTFAPLADVRARLMREMAAALVKQGLYAKEAQAMVDTWKDQWFSEEGTRALYLLPRVWTDGTLPLAIKPQPGRVTRVMVGRAELITPTMVRELNKQVTAYQTGDDDVKLQALTEVRALGLGRFLEPVTRKLLGKTPDKDFAQAAWKVASEASQPVDALDFVNKFAAF